MTESTAPLLLDIDGTVARFVFNRPAVLNAIDLAMSQAVLDAVRHVATMPDVRVIVMSGAGRAFMAGGDLSKFHAALPDAGPVARAIIAPLHEALELLADMPQPVVASVHGAVAGAGMSLALAADLAIAADDTKFTLAYARIGASPDASSTWSLPRLVGLRRALELALLSDTIDAARALDLGLVNRVVPAARLADETDALVRRLASGPTSAYGRTKRLLRKSLGNDLRTQLAAERDAFIEGASTADFAEGLNAFLAKRPPEFRGR